ncbi:Mss4-like protein [Sparassis latifolia]|uniref:CENP-V/GFA domain-containing protein n=1 Tax=Sparassis crispa TaxID=139825 RepID=A0A401GRQ2_9APHY|nr:hypothetical protein SCP_0603830 [Sparassis crispa]GBE84404.1 hypothetical protein SCP_0603830 [Sparassis crispa]
MPETLLKGSCYCGSVSYSVAGGPVLSAYCHCINCQRLSGCPFIHTVHVEFDAFSWTHPPPHGAQLESYTIENKPWKTRWRCKQCGVCVAGHNAQTDNWSIWGPHLERGEDGKIKDWGVVKPTAHIFYVTRVLDVDDDLGKWEGYENKSLRLS